MESENDSRNSSDSSGTRSLEMTSDGFSEYLDVMNKQYDRIREEQRRMNEALKAQEDTEPLEDEHEVNKKTSFLQRLNECDDINVLQTVNNDGIESLVQKTISMNCFSDSTATTDVTTSNVNSNNALEINSKSKISALARNNNTEIRERNCAIEKCVKVQPSQVEHHFITPCRPLPPSKVAHSLPVRTAASTDSSQKMKIMATVHMSSCLNLNTPIYQTSNSKKTVRRNVLSNASNPSILDSVLEEDAPVVIDNPNENVKRAKPLSERKVKDVFRCIAVNDVEYLVLNELGKGGSSVVYHCFDPQRKEECALKVVDLNKDKNEAIGFINEVSALAKLSDCDRIIRLHRYQIRNDEKLLYMVLEKGERDFAQILREHSRNTAHLPPFMVHFYWMQMLHAVNQMHSKGVIHSDLKPANFIEIRDRLKLIDFGISSCVSLDVTSVVKTVALGTFGYISPEALCNDRNANGASDQPAYKVGFKSDVWSLGCILYQLVYKRTPFAHIQHNSARFAAIMDPHHVIDYPPAAWVPKGVIACIATCLRYNARQRPSVTELIRSEHSMNT